MLGGVETMEFASFGAGWFAAKQLAAWREVEGARCVALYNRTRAKAEELADRLGVPRVYSDAEELLRNEKVSFVDLVVNPFALPDFVHLAARHRVPVICQKPMAPSVEIGRALVRACREAGIPLYVHENWRWQAPIRRLKAVLGEGRIGEVFRARITMVSGYDVYRNEPTLRWIEKFILTDMGTHILDIVRFLFGEADRLYCQTHRVHPDIRGEDVATVMLSTNGGHTTVSCEMGYPGNAMEHDCFPQTLVYVEGQRGTAEIAPDYCVRVTTADGTHARRHPPTRYPFSDAQHELVDASIVDCNRHLLAALRGETAPETPGEDNLKTLELVHRCYDSAREGTMIRLS